MKYKVLNCMFKPYIFDPVGMLCRCRSVLQPRAFAVFVSSFPAKAGPTQSNNSPTLNVGACFSREAFAVFVPSFPAEADPT